MKPKRVIPRASIRISLNGDTNSKIRNKLRDDAFVPNGFVNASGAEGTGTWVNWGCTPMQMAKCMQSMWSILEKKTNRKKVDHVWSNYEKIDADLLEERVKEFDFSIIGE